MTNETNKKAADTTHCWSCKKEIVPTHLFCPHCGAKVSATAGMGNGSPSTADANAAKEEPVEQPASTSPDNQIGQTTNERVAGVDGKNDFST